MLLKSGIVVAVFTLISRILGLIRELFVAATFGSGNVADCVNVAFKLPNLLRRIFGEGALSSVFIPIFSAKLLESRKSALIFSGKVFILLLFTLIALSVIIQITMPYFLMITAPGFYQDEAKYQLAITLCRITTPYLIFISVTALLGGMLNSVKRFTAFAATPIIMNISLIIFTIFFSNYIRSDYAITIALLLSGVLQLIFIYYCIVRANLKFPIIFDKQDKSVTKLLHNLIPASMGSGAQQINLFITQSIASFIPGTISILSYAERIYQLPLSLAGVTFSTILLPELSKIYKNKDIKKAHVIQNKSIQLGIAISLPASIGLILISHPIIHILYERGAFVASNTDDVSQALKAFAFGLPAFILSKIITTIFYANHDTKTPFKITIIYTLINIISNIILMTCYGFIGVAIGTSISAWINLILLYRYSKKYGNFNISLETKIVVLKLIISSFCVVVFLFTFNHYYSYLLYSTNSLIKIFALIGIIFLSMLIFSVACVMQNLHRIFFTKFL